MDQAGLERLVRDHGSALLGLLTYRTGDRHLAEELLGDVFERAYKARRRYDPRRASERTWLTAIALNVWRDHARRQAAEARALSAWTPPAPPRDLEADVLQRRSLLDALDGLPEDEREALALVYGADLTAKQAAKALDVPLTTVQGRVYRGLKQLRETLDEDR